MEGSRRICALIIVFLCFVQDFASCSEILQGPQNVTVLAGSNASFTCTVKAGWQSISWFLKDIFVVSISSNAGTIVSNGQLVVRNSTNTINGEFTTEIIIINVQKNNSGTVRCSSLAASFEEAYLTVQVKGSVQVASGSSITVAPNTTVSISCQALGWYPAPTITWNMNNTVASTIYYITDYTTGTDGFVSAVSTFTINPMADTNLTCLAKVQTLDAPVSTTVTIVVREGTSSGLSRTAIILIAVFASIGGLLLLIVIIALIVIFCRKKKKKRKETGYQSDAWKAPQRDVSNLQTIDRVSLGEHNYANYAYTPDLPSAAPSFRSNHSDSAFSETTVTPRSSSSKVGWLNTTDDHLKKTRHVTHV